MPTHRTQTPRNQGGLGDMQIPLLADRNQNIARSYGVLHEQSGNAFRYCPSCLFSFADARLVLFCCSRNALRRHLVMFTLCWAQRAVRDRREGRAALASRERYAARTQCGRGAAAGAGVSALRQKRRGYAILYMHIRRPLTPTSVT